MDAITEEEDEDIPFDTDGGGTETGGETEPFETDGDELVPVDTDGAYPEPLDTEGGNETGGESGPFDTDWAREDLESGTDLEPQKSPEEGQDENWDDPWDIDGPPPPLLLPSYELGGEELVPEGDDSMYGGTGLAQTRSILLSDLIIGSVEEARPIAEWVIEVLEGDVQAYLDRVGHSFPSDEPQSYSRAPDGAYGSRLSVWSNYSLPAIGEPSQLKLWYEKGNAEPYRTSSIPRVRLGETADAETEANLHRSAKKFGDWVRPEVWDDFAQTRELALVNHSMAEKLWRHLYPLKEDYTPPAPASRKPSLVLALDAADNEKEDADRGRIGPKVSWPKRKRLLPPPPDNYFRGETFWTGSIFRGQYVNRQFNHGNYNYPLMATYESEFREGHAHSRKHLGLVVYPRGDTFEGQWRKGRFMSGNITFGDELKFEPQDWDYCVAPDRRFYIERDVGVKEAGRTLYNDRLPPPFLLPGWYDTGDGVFDPKTGEVTGYNGQKLRDTSPYEREWILANCRKAKEVHERYVPSFSVDRLPASVADKYVKQ